MTDSDGPKKLQDQSALERKSPVEFKLPKAGETSNLPLHLIGGLFVLTGFVVRKRRRVE